MSNATIRCERQIEPAMKEIRMKHERIQGDIFDHILAVLPELGLRLFQSPTGRDLSLGLSLAAESHRPSLPGAAKDPL